MTPPREQHSGRQGGAPCPWLQRLFAFSRPSHLSGPAAPQGAELFLRNPTSFEQASCPGQLRCLGQSFSQKSDFFEQATCPGQLRCLGQNFLSNSDLFFLHKPLVPGSFVALGQNFFSTYDLFFLNKPLVPGSFAAWGSFFSKYNLF